MTSDTEIYSSLDGIISKVSGYPVSELNKDINLQNDLLVDSLKLMEILARIEIEFEVTLDEDDLAGLDTLGDFYSYVIKTVNPG